MTKALLIVLLLFPLVGTAQSQNYPPLWNSASIYKRGDVVRYPEVGGNEYRYISTLTTPNHPVNSPIYWELRAANSNTTINVGPNLFQTWWNYVKNATIRDQVLVTLKVSEAADQTFSAPFSLNHPYGSRIVVAGVGPNLPKFLFNNSDGLYVDSGHSIRVSNILIRNTGAQKAFNGFRSYTGGSAYLDHLLIDGFETCLIAKAGSAYVSGGSEFTGSGAVVVATSAAFIQFQPGTVISGSGVDGLLLESIASMIEADGCTLQNGTTGGLAAFNGLVSAQSALLKNLQVGLSADANGSIYAYNATYTSVSLNNKSQRGGVIVTTVMK